MTLPVGGDIFFKLDLLQVIRIGNMKMRQAKEPSIDEVINTLLTGTDYDREQTASGPISLNDEFDYMVDEEFEEGVTPLFLHHWSPRYEDRH